MNIKNIRIVAAKYLPTLFGRIKAKPSMRIVYIYVAIAIVFIVTYYAAWVIDFYMKGNPQLEELRAYTLMFFGAAGFFAFIRDSLVDKNRNGIPDKAEEGKTQGEGHAKIQ